MPVCTRGHNHNTEEGVKKCDFKRAEKNMKRSNNGFTWNENKIQHNPARIVEKGPFKIAIFQEGSRIIY